MRSTMLRMRSSASMLAMAMAAPLVFAMNPAQANPAGGTVTSGSAVIANPSSNATQVQQTSEGVVIDWSSFNVGKGQTTTFVQPNAQAIAVNRIGGGNATQIFGTLDANGRIVLINGNGILFGKGSQVNVGGLLATSSDAGNADMLAGKANFTRSGNAGAQIVNQGAINASQGGFVALVAPSVRNTGTVQAKLGNVTLAGANNFTVDFNGDGLISFAAPAAGRGEVSNSGNLAGATITMDARSAEGAAVSVVNAGGTIVAQGAHLQGGNIVLDGGTGGNIDVSGSLNASGAGGGGTIAVGYSQNALAGNITLEKGSDLSADATQSGNGGSVKIDSQNDTEFNGLISAKGAGAAGTGGNVELSTKGVLQFTGFADTSAVSGKSGSLLLDPTDLYINTTGTAPEAGASAISVATLESELAAGNVFLQTAATGTQQGNITIANSFAWSSGNGLTLDAYRNIDIDNEVTIGATGAANLLLYADDTGRGVGTVNFIDKSAIDANNSVVSIFYNPVNYDTPTNFSGNVVLTNGASLQADMLVNNLTQLQEIGADATTLAGSYVLGRAIDAKATSGWNAGAGFIPIGDAANPFTGSFNGDYYSISHLFIDSSSNDVGLFGVIGASGRVSGVTVTSASITGGSYTGGLAGSNAGTIYGSDVSGTVNGTAYTGGLVGTNSGNLNFDGMNGSVTGTGYTGGLAGASTGAIYGSSTEEGTVSGTDYVGGLAGYTVGSVEYSSSSDIVRGSEYIGGLIGESNGSSVNVSSASGKVEGVSVTYAGGLIGEVEDGGSITYSDATGSVTGNSDVGGLVGYDAGGTIANSYATGNVVATVSAGSNALAGGLVGEEDTLNGVPGSITSSYAIGSVTADGYSVGGLVGENFANITSSYAEGNVVPYKKGASYVGGLVGGNDGSITNSYSSGSVTGVYDVGGLIGLNAYGSITSSYSYSSVTGIGHEPSQVGGLVGDNFNGEILDSYTTDGSVSVAKSISGSSDIGGLIGFNNGGSVTGSYSQDPVTVGPGAEDIGGLIGLNNAGTIDQSYATGNVMGGESDVGGLVGLNETNSTIENSYATGAVVAQLGTKIGTEGVGVGGLVGENQAIDGEALIVDSYATGAVKGNDEVGGLVGVNDSGAQIETSEATGNVTATADPAVVGDGTDAGGLVGLASGTISNVYATGKVSGYNDVGGLIGFADSGLTVSQAYSIGVASASDPSSPSLGASVGLSAGATLTDVYWDSTTDPTLNGIGSVVGADTTMSLTTKQLRSGLPAGFSAAVWGSNKSIDGGLPYLLALQE